MTLLLGVAVFGRLKESFGTDRGRRVLSDLGADNSVSVVRTTAVAVAMAAGAVEPRDRLESAVALVCMAQVAPLPTGEQPVDLQFLSLPLRLHFIIAQALLGHRIRTHVSVWRLDLFLHLVAELGLLVRRLRAVRLERRRRRDVGRSLLAPLPLLAARLRRRQVWQRTVTPAVLRRLPAVIVAPKLIPQASRLLRLPRLLLVIGVFRRLECRL